MTDVISLKLMCVIDFQLENNRLYRSLQAVPKLMEQLLNFYSFGAFKYYKYKMARHFNIRNVLKCKQCEFFGPYLVVLEHMTINHNIHVNTNLCMWCEKTDLQTHISQNTTDQCYRDYVNKFSSVYYDPVIPKFYELLEKLATKLNVKVYRRETFKNNHTSKRFEIISPNDQSNDIDPKIIVFRARASEKDIDVAALEEQYQTAMESLYDATACAQFFDDNKPSPSKRTRGTKRRHVGSSVGCKTRGQILTVPLLPQLGQVNSTQTMAVDGNQTATVRAGQLNQHLVVTGESTVAQSPFHPFQHYNQVNLTQPTLFSGSQPAQPLHPMVSNEAEDDRKDNDCLKFVKSLLKNMKDPQLKIEARYQIQKDAIEYSTKDLNHQLNLDLITNK